MLYISDIPIVFTIKMGETREEIIIDSYIFTDFKQKDTYTVTLYGRKVDFSKLQEKDAEDVKYILRQMDLWESFIFSISLIKKTLKEEDFDEISLDHFYRPDKYEFELWINEPSLTRGIQHNIMGVHIYYSKIEARRRTKGAKDNAPLSVEEVKGKLNNIKKWITIQKVIKFLHTI